MTGKSIEPYHGIPTSLPTYLCGMTPSKTATKTTYSPASRLGRSHRAESEIVEILGKPRRPLHWRAGSNLNR